MSAKVGADYELMARWVRPERPYPGDPDAHIADTGIPVWALVGHWKMTGRDAAVTAADYHLKPEAVQAAIAYYRLHRDVIDARLTANSAEMA